MHRTQTFQAVKTFPFKAEPCGLLCGLDTHSDDQCDPERKRIRWYRENRVLDEKDVNIAPDGPTCWVCQTVWRTEHAQTYRADGNTSWTDYAKDLGADKSLLDAHKLQCKEVIERSKADRALSITS